MWHSQRVQVIKHWRISTHTSRVGCDVVPRTWLPHKGNFYSHIPCGMWLLQLYHPLVEMYFYSHIPCGMWRSWHNSIHKQPLFLLTHPVWDVTRWQFFHWFSDKISTHTSRVGCDYHQKQRITCRCISTHTSRVGCDRIASAPWSQKWWFLLTHPVWDVTAIENSLYNHANISTHTSRVGCDSHYRV